jgi:hypothetical protein
MPVKKDDQAAGLHPAPGSISRSSVGEAAGEVKNKPSRHLSDFCPRYYDSFLLTTARYELRFEQEEVPAWANIWFWSVADTPI